MSHDVDVLILNFVEAARRTGTEDLEHAIRQLAAPSWRAGSDGCLMRSGSDQVLEFSRTRLGPGRRERCGSRYTRGSIV